MDARELAEREPFLDLATATLSRAFEQLFGHPFQVTAGQGAGQAWLALPPLHGFFTAHASGEVRRFLKNGFRYTTVARRGVPQYLLGTVLGTRAATPLARKAFSVSPPVPSAEALLLMPGNQRFRIFDFRRWTTRVVAKRGFGSRGVEGEVRFRSAMTGPFLPLIRWAADFAWYEEPIVDGYALARCPPWLDRDRAASLALQDLDRFAARTRRLGSREEYVGALMDCIARSNDVVHARFARPLVNAASLARLRDCALAGPRSIELAQTHGDLQPGNIIVVPGAHPVVVDWEHARERLRRYDGWVYSLGTRRGDRLPRLARCALELAGEARADFAAFLLEETRFYVEEASSGPFPRIPRGCEQFAGDLARVTDILRRQ